MNYDTLIILIIGWHLFGTLIGAVIAINSNADGWELANPYWVYHYNKNVNWFGAIVLALGYTALSPIVAVCYWFYKLCTIGR